MKIPHENDYKNNTESLKLYFTSGETNEFLEIVNFTWAITDFSEYSCEIQLSILNPLVLSQDDVYYSLVIQFVETSIFEGEDSQ